MSAPEAARIRDIPRHCQCLWIWDPALARHIRSTTDPDCSWHISTQGN